MRPRRSRQIRSTRNRARLRVGVRIDPTVELVLVAKKNNPHTAILVAVRKQITP